MSDALQPKPVADSQAAAVDWMNRWDALHTEYDNYRLEAQAHIDAYIEEIHHWKAELINERERHITTTDITEVVK